MSGPDVLFVGQGAGAACWHRGAVPAMHLGADWCGALPGDDGEPVIFTGAMRRPMRLASLREYDIVVLHGARLGGWADRIDGLRDAGVTVLYDAQDDAHALYAGTPRASDPRARRAMRAAEQAMAACDGVLVGTAGLRDLLAAVHPRVVMCRDGLDLGRFALTPPAHDGVVIGWPAAPAAPEAVKPWFDALDTLLGERSDVHVLTVGEPFADLLARRHGAERCQSVPMATLESLPAALTAADIVLAPPEGPVHRTDRRWLEACALGLPVVADAAGHPELRHGETGLHARSGAEALAQLRRLAGDAELRRRIGAAGRADVRGRRDMRVLAGEWAAALEAAAGRALRAAA
jgi:glycosyltransferase involved in cell wall biosynthesis